MLTEPVTCSSCGAVSVNGGTLHCHACYEAARKAQQEDSKDAARYRWLNRQDNFIAHIERLDRFRYYRLKCGDDLDRWIDERIAEEDAQK